MNAFNKENLNSLLELALSAEERMRSLWKAYFAAKYGDTDTMNAHLMSVFHLTTDKDTRKRINAILLNVFGEKSENS